MLNEIKQVTSGITEAVGKKTLNPLREKVTQSVVETFQQQGSSFWESWVHNHPVISWFLTHPVITFIILLILILLLAGLFGAIGRLTEQVWLYLLQSPLKLTRWILGLVPQTLRFSLSKPQNKNDRLSYVLNRLEEIKKEQDELWQEMTQLLKSKP